MLVVWQLETGKKTFVPRIGRGPITNICVANDSSVYAVSLQDNGIHIINAFSMKQDQLIQGISNGARAANLITLISSLTSHSQHYSRSTGGHSSVLCRIRGPIAL